VLFRGGAEGSIRTRLIQQGVIHAIIGLPANLFYGTGIPACIIVLDKEGAAGRKGIFMVDASKGFVKDGNKNRLREQDIHKIVDTFTRQLVVPKYARLVPVAEIEGNDFNLNLPRYIDSTEPEDLQDIEAHLKGGIPLRDIDGLSDYWHVFPGVRQALFADANRPGYCQLRVEPGQIKATIFDHPEFTAFNQTVITLFEGWKETNAERLTGIQLGDRPKLLIEALSESLLDTFRNHAQVSTLIDPYAVYQHLMDYWAETMQDDAWMVATDGWQALRPDGANKGQPNTDLIPTPLVVTRCFATEQTEVERLETERDAISRQMEELEEEHGGDDGLLNDAKNDKGKITAKGVKDRLKSIKADPTTAEEKQVLQQYAALADKETAANKQVKEAQRELDTKMAALYARMTQSEVQVLVVLDKWLDTQTQRVQGELDRVSQTLTGRIKQLADRYATPLPQLVLEVDALQAQVNEHLKKMGFAV